MRIYHAQIPWYIDVQASSNPVGITFADLFNAIYWTVWRLVLDGDLNNYELDDKEWKRIIATSKKRAESNRTEAVMGVRRVDFLMGRSVFAGLVEGKEGLWEMKTTKPIPLP